MCVWVEDADKLELNSNELNVVYQNSLVKNYLKSNTALGLAGIKGQGKTFLIKVKRLQSEKDNLVCLPKNHILDTVDSSIEIDKSITSYLKDYNTWVNLWKFSIACAIIHSELISNEEFKIYLPIKPMTKKLIKMKNNSHSPSVYFKCLLRSTLTNFKNYLSDTSILLDAIKDLNYGINIFIDKIDQGFSNFLKNFNIDSNVPERSRNASIWQYVQFSLAEASYDIYSNINHHIKVYYTIREEALIDSEKLNKDKARNINAYITTLNYNKQDLKQMYSLYVKSEDDDNLCLSAYKDTEPSKAFVGQEVIAHGYVPNGSENVFDYIYRHTLKRPYDIMKICRSLYLEKNSLDVRKIRHLVNAAADNILNTYLEEISSFIEKNVTDLKKFLMSLAGNIFNKSIMEDVCSLYNYESSTEDKPICAKACRDCKNMNYFNLLYNIGLLGVLQKHEADDTGKIVFEDIGSRILEIKVSKLPYSKYYFLHPAVSNYIRDNRREKGLYYDVDKNNIIGDQYPFNLEKENINKIINKIKRTIKKERIFISSTIYDLGDERKSIQMILSDNSFHPYMSEINSFDITNVNNVHSHDHCLDQMLKCGNLIFIVGENYGGIYAGEKYKKFANKIKTSSNGKIKNVSISLMELFVAKEKRIKYRVFMNSNIEKRYKSKDESLSEDVRNLINFICHFTKPGSSKVKGNWWQTYYDIEDLKEKIKTSRF